jgi:Glycosyl transferase family 2
MKVVMTLLLRDEEDIIDSMLAFHLNAGVDFVIAMDNNSVDGTTEILESYERGGQLHLIRQPELDHFEQGEWVTQMARMAAIDFGADWIINADADEFWWPRGGTLKDVFAAVPPRFGRVYAMVRHFVPRPEVEEFFAERMTVRVCNPGAEKNNPFGPRSLIAHRADPEITLNDGRHATATTLRALSVWYPVDMLHFPIRSLQQCEQKYRLRWTPLLRSGLTPPSVYGLAYEAHLAGRFEEFYETLLVDDAALARGLEDGTLAIDTRLRDALRAPQDARFDDTAVDAAYLSELGRLAEAEAPVVTQRRLEDLEARLATLERGLPARVRRGVLSWPRRPTSARHGSGK